VIESIVINMCVNLLADTKTREGQILEAYRQH
jgi:hypothetical protein